MNTLKNTLSIAAVYTSVLLGAGFASGQEILSFFVAFQNWGFLGIILSGFIFSIVGIASLQLCFNYKITNYSDFFSFIVNSKLSLFMETIVAIFLIVIFSTMLSASGATLKQSFGINFTLAVIVVSAICFVTFKVGIQAIVDLNSLLAPIMLVGGVFIGLYSFFYQSSDVFANHISSHLRNNWFISSITYASYNMVTLVVILISLNKFVINKKVAFYGALLGGISISFLGICIALPLRMHYNDVINYEIPMIKIVSSLGFFINYAYLLVFICAVFTTAISNGYAFCEWLIFKFKLNPTLAKIMVCSFGAIFAHIGFSNFVNDIYPIFGIIGFIQILVILFSYIKMLRI